METVPREVRSELSAAAAGVRSHPSFAPAYTPVEPSFIDRDAPVRIRLGLQQRAAANLRVHVWRAVRRFAVLLVADLASFYVMRELVRAVRDLALLGEGIAAPLQSSLPRGIFNGWQYAAALFAALFITGSYGRGDQRRDARRLFLACALATALPLWMTIWTRGLEPVMVQYVVTTLLVWAGLVAERRAIDRMVEWVRPAYRNAAATLFVGTADACRDAIHSPGFTRGGECRPVGFVDVHVPAALDALGHVADFRALLHRTGAEVVVVAGYLPDNRFREVVDASLEAQSQLLSVPRSIAIAGVQPNLVWRRGEPLIELTAPNLKGWQVFVKRAIDVLGAGVGLVALSPLLALVAALVKLDSPGPVFFTQVRIGQGGRRFRIAKFRTMVDGAEKRRDELLSRSVYSDPRLFKVPDDPRMTRLGRWLRRTSIDELPQLVNVLRGQMSLVGPRPPLPSEVALYEDHHYARFDVKPGITGPWQVAGRNGVTSFEAVMGLETSYIRNWSVWADVCLLAETIPVVLRMRGAF
jgi:exopolysaccharide biosynthesis polyprenyl glycosylphosphotransferase